mmetsp:Transcript_33327/g.100473  ORF Transcript_33327/g.100473 Transcript_33327/m.100473 type:complete len:210 (+) Transcript_33327:350-979(+)
MGLSVVAPPRRARRVDSLGGETATGAQLVPAEYRPRRRRDSASTECPRRDRGGAEDRAGISTMSFELKPTHPMPDDGVCFGGGKKVVDNIVWTETRDSVPGFLQSKGVPLQLWQDTHDDVVAHFRTYFTCCNCFWFNLFWYVLILIPLFIFYCKRSEFETGFAHILQKHQNAYKSHGIMMKVITVPDICGHNKSKGILFEAVPNYEPPV